MRNLVVILAAAAAIGFALPAVSAQAETAKVVIKEGGHHHRHMHRDHKKIVVIKHRRHRHHDHD